MEISVLVRQALLYGHIIAFALSLATIVKEDARFLRATRIDSASMAASAKAIKWLLLALWATGLPMIAMDVGTDISVLAGKPKLLAKLMVVGVLTLNGMLLHQFAFPMVTSKPKNVARAALLAATLGAVSTASWLYAFFVGAARFVAPYFTLFDFVILYVLMIAIAVLFAISFVRGRLEKSLKESYLTSPPKDRDYGLSVALLEAEIARLALTDIQKRLRSEHLAPRLSTQTPSFVVARKRASGASSENTVVLGRAVRSRV